MNRCGIIVRLIFRPFTFSFLAASISYEPMFCILTGYTCKAPDGHIVKLGETYHMTSYTYCHCESRHFGSNLAVCVNKAIDPIHHIDPNNPYYYVTSYVDPPQKAPVVDPQNPYYNTGGWWILYQLNIFMNFLVIFHSFKKDYKNFTIFFF